MRRTIALTVLVAFALPGLAFAEPDPDRDADGPVPAVLTPEVVEAPAPTVVELAEAEVEIVEAEAEAEHPPVMQPDRVGWWWLVGAIVIAGIILAVLI